MKKAPEQLIKCLKKKKVFYIANKLFYEDEKKARDEIYRFSSIGLIHTPPFNKMPPRVANYLAKLVLQKKREELVVLYTGMSNKAWGIQRRVLDCVKKTIAPEARRMEYKLFFNSGKKLVILDGNREILYLVEDPDLLYIFRLPEILQSKMYEIMNDLCEDYKILLLRKLEIERKKEFEKWKREVFEYAGVQC